MFCPMDLRVYGDNSNPVRLAVLYTLDVNTDTYQASHHKKEITCNAYPLVEDKDADLLPASCFQHTTETKMETILSIFGFTYLTALDDECFFQTNVEEKNYLIFSKEKFKAYKAGFELSHINVESLEREIRRLESIENNMRIENDAVNDLCSDLKKENERLANDKARLTYGHIDPVYIKTFPKTGEHVYVFGKEMRSLYNVEWTQIDALATELGYTYVPMYSVNMQDIILHYNTIDLGIDSDILNLYRFYRDINRCTWAEAKRAVNAVLNK